MRKRTGTFLIVFMSFLLSGVPLPALDTLELDGGLFIIGSTDSQSAPSPILPAIGMTFQIPRTLWIFDLETSFLLTGTYYQYANNRASPAEPEHRDFAVVCILGDFRLAYSFLKRESFSLGTDFGLSALLRIPIPLFPDASQDYGDTVSYFYAFRFVYPETGIFGTYRIQENIDLKLSLRASWPLYLLWDEEDLPFPEGLLVCGLVSVIWHLPSKES
ncbi:MAG: hypothetical protein JSV89_09700 [Spirochaetaceae bacterium]|nr:MAG: hypothetical protein JSV89_09700 [Spirochaetaceae bacterium]